MSALHFYQDQAAKQQLAADAATLENVRERCQRASDAWAALAVRTERTDNARIQAASAKLLTGSGDDGESLMTASSEAVD
ncbi:hypothetical protein [Sphingomonas quercus]|uniref:Uncharacterized protein n=1 Tax=Sphingomonas quercus TaxID=2842451 RepID=A0ABS6BNM4_9SPHN|nr:hypothetical protein [Sphingomonas quercus]MBU3078849.1 hypothetical protein [Sphingomonas quercus]